MDCRKRIYERMRSLQLYRLEAGTMVRAELESYLSVLEPFWQQVGRVCADALISSCSRQRLEQFERMLGIPINPNISLERRREIAASRMSIAPSDFNGQDWKRRWMRQESGQSSKIDREQGHWWSRRMR